MEALTRDFQDLLALFEQHGVRFVVVGGYAVAAHGHPRYTKDLVVWVEPTADNAARIVTALDEFGFGSWVLRPTISASQVRSFNSAASPGASIYSPA